MQHDRRAYVYNYRAEVLPPKNLPALPKPHKFKVHAMSDQQRAAIKDAAAHDRVLAVRHTPTSAHTIGYMGTGRQGASFSPLRTLAPMRCPSPMHQGFPSRPFSL